VHSAVLPFDKVLNQFRLSIRL